MTILPALSSGSVSGASTAQAGLTTDVHFYEAVAITVSIGLMLHLRVIDWSSHDEMCAGWSVMSVSVEESVQRDL